MEAKPLEAMKMRTTELQNAAGHLRSWAPTLFVAALLFGFAFTAQEVTEGEPIAFDRWLTVAFRRSSDLSRPIGPAWLVDVVRDITALGSTAVLALLVTFVTTFLFTTGKHHAGLFVLTTVLSGAVLNTLLKLVFARTRPDIVTPLTQVSTLSFPSGHAASSAVCYLTLGLMLAQTQASRSVRIHLIMTAAILTLLVGVSRIYLGVHYPSDVLAGWCFGIAWALLCRMLMSYFQRTGRIEQPGD